MSNATNKNSLVVYVVGWMKSRIDHSYAGCRCVCEIPTNWSMPKWHMATRGQTRLLQANAHQETIVSWLFHFYKLQQFRVYIFITICVIFSIIIIISPVIMIIPAHYIIRWASFRGSALTFLVFTNKPHAHTHAIIYGQVKYVVSNCDKSE